MQFLPYNNKGIPLEMSTWGRYHSKVFLQYQIWIVNYYVKSLSKNLSNENVNTGVSVVFKTKHELNSHYSFGYIEGQSI